MPMLEYFLICESISVDHETNRISLFNVIDELHVAAANNAAPVATQLVAVSSWNRVEGDEERELQAKLKIHGHHGEPIEFPVNFRMDRPRYRLVMRMQGIPAARDSELRFELLLNDQHQASHSILIHAPVHPTEPSGA